jgi:hypothetical protein
MEILVEEVFLVWEIPGTGPDWLTQRRKHHPKGSTKTMKMPFVHQDEE